MVMGIMNITPDSFYTGSRFSDIDTILKQFEKMVIEGAAIIDIGGQSTRPGSIRIEADEELQRVIPVIEAVHREFPEMIVSVDTYYSIVAKESIAAGASIVNDISGGKFDQAMLRSVGALGVPYVCMHTKGSPETMQVNPTYTNVTLEVLDYFIEKIEACGLAGIKDIIVDPGFGFAKTIRHNFELLKNLSTLKMLNKPIMLGLSRKATVYKTLKSDPGSALNGTTVLNTIGLLNGADILRVHDVKEAMEAIQLLQEYGDTGSN